MDPLEETSVALSGMKGSIHFFETEACLLREAPWIQHYIVKVTYFHQLKYQSNQSKQGIYCITIRSNLLHYLKQKIILNNSRKCFLLLVQALSSSLELKVRII